MYSVMIVPFVCFELAAGSVLTTLSLSIVALSTVLTLPTVNPADSSIDLASSWLLFDTSGTVAVCGPVENHTDTVEPFSTFDPPFGFCLVIVPSA